MSAHDPKTCTDCRSAAPCPTLAADVCHPGAACSLPSPPDPRDARIAEALRILDDLVKRREEDGEWMRVATTTLSMQETKISKLEAELDAVKARGLEVERAIALDPDVPEHLAPIDLRTLLGLVPQATDRQVAFHVGCLINDRDRLHQEKCVLYVAKACHAARSTE